MDNEEIYTKIRLSKSQIDVIISAFKNNFPNTDQLWIFGSRVGLTARGGDIDLYIETTVVDAKDVLDNKFKMISDIWSKIGGQKIYAH